MESLGLAGYRSVFDTWPAPASLLDLDLVIVDSNEAHQRSLGRSREEMVGRRTFDLFPDPDGLGEAGPLGVSMRTALRTGRPHRMPLLRYPIEHGGTLVERWWSVVNTPLLGADGRPVGILNTLDDLTELMAERESSRMARAVAEDLRRQSERLSGDLRARHQDLREVRQAEARASRRLAALAEVALELGGAETVDGLTGIVLRGLAVLGADGAAVGVINEEGTSLRLHLTDSLGADAQRMYSTLALHEELPATVAARTGRPVLIPDRAAGTTFSAAMTEGYATFGREAWAALPLHVGERVLGSITVSWESPQDFAVGEVELLTAFAAQCAQALDRLLQRQDRTVSGHDQPADVRGPATQACLTPPVQPDHLQIAVRYVPAGARGAGRWGLV
ncbi:PAS domain S-box-containing protein [Modestobacter marinus]|uniref:PAS domain S-box-containing protein n=1 Tax=Modestobacter marinus TaxID=477641 RepID=A0A846LS49_9ACTN|nr:GAF domain-containing protein [Modestobacter marinus]NIH70321.1 PAS domain S-box-containing protein [Modestobacter marinus]